MSLETIDRYRVIRRLGAGGMGEVYLAADPVLGREVAIKLLPERATEDTQARGRLLQEARLAARLDHPNICSIHEIGDADGRPFIVMQYIEGRPLDEILAERRLELEESLDIAVQMASALVEAHRRDIIHRDIKPSNVLVTPRGVAKMLDFGVSKLAATAETEPGSGDLETLAMTRTGVVLGTLPYMSPEQAQGHTVDARSDIFSFGVMLFQMIYGRHPFAAASPTATLAALLSRDPEPPADAPPVPAELETILASALAKNRAERYASAEDLLADLVALRDGTRSVTGAVPSPADAAALASPSRRTPAARPRGARVGVPGVLLALAAGAAILYAWGLLPWGRTDVQVDSIAVLPLVNVSGNADLDFLADGLAELIISRLAPLPDLRVMSRQAAFVYRGPEVDPRQVGRDLGVDAVLLGRIDERDEEFDVHLELVSAADASALWTGTYHRALADLVGMQSDMAREISFALRAQLSGEELARIARPDTEDPEASRLFLRGQYNHRESTEEAIRRAITFYEQAIARDPGYALAYAQMSLAYNTLAANYVAPSEVLQEARNASNRALALDDSLADAHYAAGNIAFLFDWDWKTAEERFRRAIDLNPNFALVRTSYGALLWTIGRYEESITQHQRAVDLDPAGVLTTSNLAIAYYIARRYGDARRQGEEMMELQPDLFFTYVLMGWVNVAEERFEEALAVLQMGEERTGGPGRERERLRIRLVQAQAFAEMGRGDDARTILAEARSESESSFVWPTELAVVYASLGDLDEAMAWLQRAYEARTPWAAFAGVDPRFDPLRGDERFVALMTRIGVPRAAVALPEAGR